MRRTLGALVLTTLLLAGCGDDGDGADDRGPTAQAPTEEPSVEVEDEQVYPEGQAGDGWALVEIVHATAAGGRVSATPTPIADEQAVADFSAQFTRPQMQAEILRVVEKRQAAEDAELVASVIAIGCDVPTGVSYVDGEVTALKVPSPGVQCLAPVTSVAILAVEA